MAVNRERERRQVSTQKRTTMLIRNPRVGMIKSAANSIMDFAGYVLVEFAFGVWGDGTTTWSAPLYNPKNTEGSSAWNKVSQWCYTTGSWFYGYASKDYFVYEWSYDSEGEVTMSRKENK